MYDDPRLVDLYDADNPDGPDHDFFRATADELGAGRIIDLGCGTGILTATLVGPGRHVIGIDPSTAMLERARTRPGGEQIEWVEGAAAQITPESADLVVMSGNVAMHILGADWHETLERIAAGLRPGGKLVFETRNPEVAAWKQWATTEVVRDTPVGVIRESVSVTQPDSNGVLSMHVRTEFAVNDVVVNSLRLQFRTSDRVVEDLAAAGLLPVAVYGGWGREQFVPGSGQRLIVVVAQSRSDWNDVIA